MGRPRTRSSRAATVKDNIGMDGIQFVTDEKGRRVAVQLDLKKHRELWEDIEDVLVSRSRRNEKRVPLAQVKAGLVKSGKLAR
jgi:hypothetical protein